MGLISKIVKKVKSYFEKRGKTGKINRFQHCVLARNDKNRKMNMIRPLFMK